jgi:hypothetical protein
MHCLDIVLSFGMATADGNKSFSIVLPNEVIETMMDLKPSKMYGANRAEIAAQLIKDMLKQLSAQGLVRKWPVGPR